MTKFLPALSAIALAAPASAQAPALHIAGWARPTVAAQKSAAAYVSIHNGGRAADRLLSVSTPAAAAASVHATSTRGGIVRMRAAGALPIGAGSRIEMKPGGLHIMLTGLKAPLRAGQKLPLTLRFERAGLVRTALPIQMSALVENHGHHGH